MSETQSPRLVIATFERQESAKHAFGELKRARKNDSVHFQDAAVVRRQADERLQIEETHDMSTGRAAAIGAAIGAVLGLLVGPAGVVVVGAAGAWFGGLAAGAVDSGIPDLDLAEIGALLTPDLTAIVVLTGQEHAVSIESWLRQKGGAILAGATDAPDSETPTPA